METNNIAEVLNIRKEKLSKLGLERILARRKDMDGTSPYLKENAKITAYLQGKEPEPIPTREIKK